MVWHTLTTCSITFNSHSRRQRATGLVSLTSAADLVAAHPEVRFVVDHAGYMTRRTPALDDSWHTGLLALAASVYLVDVLEILQLRTDVEKKEGKNFSLQNFHDEFLRQGFPPIAVIRRAMLGDDSPAL